MSKWRWLMAVGLSAGLLGTMAVRAAEATGKLVTATAKEVVEEAGCRVEKFALQSRMLNKGVKVIVILPPEYKSQPDKKYPILYTLHGRGAPYGTWASMMPLKRALKKQPMIVTCLDGGKTSWYIDATKLADSKYTSFFLEEFIPYVDANYRVDGAARNVTGFSMGGFGAFHFMLEKPELFASVSSLSGAFFPMTDKMSARLYKDFKAMLGDYAKNKEAYEKIDLYRRLAACAASKTPLPPIMLNCGLEDQLLKVNQEMRDLLKEKGFACEYHEGPGKHNWKFWVGASAGVVDFHWQAIQKKKGK
jgi:putative tributyrin esterase